MTSLLFNIAEAREKISYQSLALGLLCALIAIILLFAEYFTAPLISLRIAEDRQALLEQVLPSELYDNQPLEESLKIHDVAFSEDAVEIFIARKHSKLSAFVFEINTQGYGGLMSLLIAMDVQGKIIGLRTLKHKETPGLADKIELSKSDWILSFNGESLKKTSKELWAVKKDGGKFDQFTGATITPRAIVRRVYQSLVFYQRQQGELLSKDIKSRQDQGKGISKGMSEHGHQQVEQDLALSQEQTL
ncbi:electron transport complex subunit RsxG [Agaribacterium sp. ZY112]|uniref:electron transport complex subunit RsxG n=1 Tax=Agaribacterium sp. ZY112 TaxID=3233574 RepID=UPI0035261A89